MSVATQSYVGTKIGSGCIGARHSPGRPLGIDPGYIAQSGAVPQHVRRDRPCDKLTISSHMTSAPSGRSTEQTELETSIPSTPRTKSPARHGLSLSSLKRRISSSNLAKTKSQSFTSRYLPPSERYTNLSLAPQTISQLHFSEAQVSSLGIIPSSVSSDIFHNLATMSESEDLSEKRIYEELVLDPFGEALRDQIEIWERHSRGQLNTTEDGTISDPRILADGDEELEKVPREKGLDTDYVSGGACLDSSADVMMSGGLG